MKKQQDDRPTTILPDTIEETYKYSYMGNSAEFHFVNGHFREMRDVSINEDTYLEFTMRMFQFVKKIIIQYNVQGENNAN
jgi:hypothetical protein